MADIRPRSTDVSMATRFRPRGTLFVGGMVRTPGPIAISGTITLQQAIELTGGTTEFGSLRRVKVYRGGEAKIYDLAKGEMAIVILRADDTVEVPQKISWGS